MFIQLVIVFVYLLSSYASFHEFLIIANDGQENGKTASDLSPGSSTDGPNIPESSPFELQNMLSLAIALQQRFSLENERRSGEVNSCDGRNLVPQIQRYFPAREVTRIWGIIAAIRIPCNFRYFVILLACLALDIDLSESRRTDYSEYLSLSDLFTRELKPGIRPISPTDVVSPCDCMIQEQGRLINGVLGPVKNQSLTIGDLLGPQNFTAVHSLVPERLSDSDDAAQNLKHHPNNEMYYQLYFLTFNRYHRWHSPVDWKITFRRHFTAELFGVGREFTEYAPNAVALNERVAFIGEWKYGFFSMVPVGAVTVGSIQAIFDGEIHSNNPRRAMGSIEDKVYNPSIDIRKGQEMGQFNFGSAIVLVYEGPEGAHFIQPTAGQNFLNYGQPVAEFYTSLV